MGSSTDGYTPPTPFGEYCSTDHDALVNADGDVHSGFDAALRDAIGPDWDDTYLEKLEQDSEQAALYVSTDNMDIVFYEFQTVGGSQDVNAYATPREPGKPERTVLDAFTADDRQWEEYLLNDF